jgi:iron-sulfur cluster repair protein YtfE (RIC family)
MTEILNIDNAVLKLSQEHKLIIDYAVKFSRNRKNPDPAFLDGLESFLSFLRKDLTRHFKIEELVFFPAILNSDPSYMTSLLVLNLQKDHGSLENRLKTILALEKRLKEEKRREKMLEKIGHFLDDLKDHARREIQELFPVMDANESCMALLEEYAALHRNT